MEHKHQHQNPQALSDAEMHLRCPTCFKLYAVDAKTIYEPKPEFQCVQCEQRFWINFPEALEFSETVGFPSEWQENYENIVTADEMAGQSVSQELEGGLLEKMTFEGNKQNLSYVEEPSAPPQQPTNLKQGVIQSEMKNDIDFEESAIKADETKTNEEDQVGTPNWTLAREWEKVINNYEVRAYHRGFIEEAQKLGALDFAYNKYRELKSINPFDKMAKEGLRFVESLMQKQDVVAAKLNRNKKAMTGSTAVASNAKGLRAYYKYLPWTALAIAAIMIAIGFSSESLNHFAGLGFAIIFLTGALSLLKESDL